MKWGVGVGVYIGIVRDGLIGRFGFIRIDDVDEGMFLEFWTRGKLLGLEGASLIGGIWFLADCQPGTVYSVRFK